jgi:hypothetical protein
MKAWRMGNQKIAARISEIQHDKFLTPEQKETAIKKLRSQRMSKRQVRMEGKIKAEPSLLLCGLMLKAGCLTKQIADEIDVAAERDDV